MAKEEQKEKGVLRLSPNPLFSWQAPEFIKYEKSKKWFVYLISIAALLIIFFAYERYWTAMVLVFVATLFLVTLAETKPKNIICAVYPEGVVVDNKVYSFGQFKSFWITGAEGLAKFYLQLTGRFAGQVIMPIVMDQDIEQIRLLIAKYVTEEEPRQDVNDTINKLLRL